MIAQYRTENSVYEVDEDAKRCRRVTGRNDPTPNQGTDGEWQQYHSADVVNGCLLIIWGFDGTTLRTTYTSPLRDVQVVTVEPVPDDPSQLVNGEQP